MLPRHVPEKSKNRKFHHVVQFARFPRPSWGIFARHGRQNASKMPPRASKVCLRPSRPLPKSASKSLLLRPRPFTKGGLAVVRPRRPSSIVKKMGTKNLQNGRPNLPQMEPNWRQEGPKNRKITETQQKRGELPTGPPILEENVANIAPSWPSKSSPNQ